RMEEQHGALPRLELRLLPVQHIQSRPQQVLDQVPAGERAPQRLGVSVAHLYGFEHQRTRPIVDDMQLVQRMPPVARRNPGRRMMHAYVERQLIAAYDVRRTDARARQREQGDGEESGHETVSGRNDGAHSESPDEAVRFNAGRRIAYAAGRRTVRRRRPHGLRVDAPSVARATSKGASDLRLLP